MPTGGININNVKDYLAIDRVYACGGTWMVDKTMINEGRWDEIGRLAREAADLVK
jgi:2-dehydro-3-deoxyphosphogluconate aldolase/(4S)-4-hydroxy-2-oxoglutarate aldolase